MPQIFNPLLILFQLLYQVVNFRLKLILSLFNAYRFANVFLSQLQLIAQLALAFVISAEVLLPDTDFCYIQFHFGSLYLITFVVK
jgi:hypothetical protein